MWLDYTCSRLYANLDAFYPMEVKSNGRSSWVNLAFTVFSKNLNSHLVNMNDPVFSITQGIQAQRLFTLHAWHVFLGMISKIKTKHASELQ